MSLIGYPSISKPDQDLRAKMYDLLEQCLEQTRASLIKVGEENQRYETALRAIIARADTDKPGTSKVQDMRRIAVEALGPTGSGE